MLMKQDILNPEILKHFAFVDDADEAWDIIRQSMVDEE